MLLRMIRACREKKEKKEEIHFSSPSYRFPFYSLARIIPLKLVIFSGRSTCQYIQHLSYLCCLSLPTQNLSNDPRPKHERMSYSTVQCLAIVKVTEASLWLTVTLSCTYFFLKTSFLNWPSFVYQRRVYFSLLFVYTLNVGGNPRQLDVMITYNMIQQKWI